MGHEPENTIRSFKKALALHVDAIELDVYVCKTGELVVIHDDKVDRTTNGVGYTEDKTFTELRQLDAGKGELIPTLEEVLDVVDKSVIVNIELKGRSTAFATYQVIDKYINEKGWSELDFMVSSFDHHELNKFKHLYPQIPIGVLLEGVPLSYADCAVQLNAQSINLSLDFINQDFVNDAHQKGLQVYVYTVNDYDDIAKVKKLNIDGIFCNFPERL
ncbi:glycerophosphodiester phosphodiesterase [Colwellia hornerae]|uniref:Glycerophosphodiester phosphodiesterase n=2 Tax=Colwellia hornerae TaxID=89402 RepID=A0A5C6QET0_9GAMM|nr:glycerophosphodiester phosphodiesterase [Colwellia hornerae]TWX57883.1 glycerophosphodiester phosphodiesterase [Colwellia hornerae]TWX67585.1 glycerophosphodiester phosphodiesterase [Colwellia hornerae]